MQSNIQIDTKLWTGRALTAVAVLFLTVDAGMKLLTLPPAVEATTQLGYPASAVFTLGVIQLVCLALYLIPRTAPVGAVLWTGYLGGAVATHFRVSAPLFSNTLFPIYVAILIWGGLFPRDRRVSALIEP